MTTHEKYEPELTEEELDSMLAQWADTELDVTTEIIIYLSDGTLDTQVTKQVNIDLPQLDDFDEMGWMPEDYQEGAVVTYTLTIRQGDKEYYNVENVELGKNSYVTVDLTGTGIQLYEVLINGQSWKKVEVDFTKA